MILKIKIGNRYIKFKESQNKQNLYNEMLNDKLFEHLSNYVKVKVIEQSTNELRKKQAA